LLSLIAYIALANIGTAGHDTDVSIFAIYSPTEEIKTGQPLRCPV
jgi:hypothetical protein